MKLMRIKYLKYNLQILFVLILNISFSQSIQINEVVSSNSSLQDIDGDTPDWIELYNPTNSSISISGWSITDKVDKPDKWIIENATIESNSYLLLMASGKDRQEGFSPRTLINQGDEWQYLIPNQAVDSDWTSRDFDDSSWSNGISGFGYADSDDATIVPVGTRSVFMRRVFDIENIDHVSLLILDVDYDDAFVAYLNGVEIARANINGNPPNYNATSIVDHEAVISTGGKPDRFEIPVNQLINGKNVLSIQAHNISSTSSDFTIIPFLSAYFNTDTNQGATPPTILDLRAQTRHTNFKLSSDETIYLYDETGEQISSLALRDSPVDVSTGIRTSDQSIVLFDPPTPGAANNGQGYEGIVESKLIFSNDGGTVSNLTLSISGANAGETIRYTTNAKVPNQNSTVYTSPININSNTIIRARIFKNGLIASKTESRSYLIDVDHDIPVISLVTDPDNLFSDEKGIYTLGDGFFPDYPYFGSNIWEEWERPVNLSLYEPDGNTLSLDAGIKIFGGWSRAQDQRSFSIFARGQYGVSEINFPLFPQNEYNKYQGLVLRNSGNDFMNTNIRDAALTTLMNGSGIETQAYRPVATYINGEYWGMYNMREKVNEHFLASRFDVETDNIDLIGPGGELIHGSDEDLWSLVQYLESNSLSSEENYNVIVDQVDIDNFIMYQLAQIYFDNMDWPGNNIKYWKPKQGKWRWILYDTDFGFGIWNSQNYTSNTLAFALDPSGPNWPNPPGSTLLFRRLVENITFRNKFVNQFADELNSRFLPTKVRNHITQIDGGVFSEIGAHYNRWNGNLVFRSLQIDNMKQFASLRPARIKTHLKSQFNLPNHHRLTLQIDDVEKGFIELNSLHIEQDSWQGDYFENVPVNIKAVAKPGYKFMKWAGASVSTDAELVVDMKSALTLTAIFELSNDDPNIIINEINYNSSGDHDSGDWIELHNPYNTSIDLSDWTITDNTLEDGFTIPNGTVIAGGDFMIFTRDISKFNMLYPEIDNAIGDLSFGLSSNGDVIKIYDTQGDFRDSVAYLSIAPWPQAANGQGPSIELKNPSLDNSLPENWGALHEFGSPGKSNEDSTEIMEQDPMVEFNRYPNPFQNMVYIDFGLNTNTNVEVNLYNLDGILVHKLYNNNLIAGNYSISKDLSFLARGIYILEYKEGEKTTTSKWLKN